MLDDFLLYSLQLSNPDPEVLANLLHLLRGANSCAVLQNVRKQKEEEPHHQTSIERTEA